MGRRQHACTTATANLHEGNKLVLGKVIWDCTCVLLDIGGIIAMATTLGFFRAYFWHDYEGWS